MNQSKLRLVQHSDAVVLVKSPEMALLIKVRKEVRHWLHYRWNWSRLNNKLGWRFNVWTSQCSCCCGRCEDIEEKKAA